MTNDPNAQKLMSHKKNIIFFVSMIKEREREEGLPALPHPTIKTLSALGKYKLISFDISM